MRFKQFVFRRVGFALGAAAFALVWGGSSLPWALAEGNGGAGSGGAGEAAGVMTGMSGNPSAQFDAARQAAMGSLFSTCQGSTWANAVGAVAACYAAPPGDLKDVLGKIECSSFSVDGVFSADILSKKRKSLEQMLGGLKCQQAKFDGARGQLQCLSEQAAALTAQIGALGTEYQQNIARFQKELNEINSQVVDRKDQQREVKERINGNGEVGDEGLMGAKREIEALLTQMPGEITAFKHKTRQLGSLKKEYEEQVGFRTAGLARECFDTRPGDYRCRPNGPVVSYKEHVLCIYEQQQFVRRGGVVEDNRLNQAQAAGKRAGLEQLLNELFSEAPDINAGVPGAEGAQSSGALRVNVLTADDISRRYGSRLEKFGVRDKILGRVTACFDQAKTTVAKERGMESTKLGKAREQILAMERENQKVAEEAFQKYNQSFTKAMGALTGENYPLGLQACEGGKSAVQEGCMENIKNAMKSLLLGTTPDPSAGGGRASFEMDIIVRASKPQNLINFRCLGIEGCLRKFQNISRNLDKEVSNLRAFKRDYVTRANLSMEQATQRFAQVLAPQNRALEQQLRSINSTLAGLGIKGVVTPKGVEAEAFEREGEVGGDSDTDMGGLYKAPKDLLNLVGGKMAPPMLDISKDSFKDALSGVVEASSRLDDKKSKIADALTTLEGLASECPGQAMDKALGKLDDEIRKFDSCYGSKQWCRSNQDALQSLLSSIQEIGDGVGGTADALNNGITNCEKIVAEQGEASGSAAYCDTSRAIAKASQARDLKRRLERGASKAATAF